MLVGRGTFGRGGSQPEAAVAEEGREETTMPEERNILVIRLLDDGRAFEASGQLQGQRGVIGAAATIRST
jgi:hypothetical protein